MTAILLVLALFFLAASAYFSGFETGIYSLDKVRLRISAERGDRRARRIQTLTDDMPGLLATLLCGNNLVLEGATFVVILLLAQRGIENPEYLATLLMTPTVFIFGEVLPKNLFRRRPDSLMYPLSFLALWSRWSFWPLVVVLRALSAVVARIGPGMRKETLFSRQSLGFVLGQGVREGTVSPLMKRMADNIMRLGRTYMRQVMVPLDRAAVLHEGEGVERLKELARESGFSRFPYIGADGRARGVIHIFALAMAEEETPIEDLMHKPVEFHAEFPIDDALFILQRRKRPIAVVVQSDGAAVGIVTVKDLVEEIVGDIEAW